MPMAPHRGNIQRQSRICGACRSGRDYVAGGMSEHAKQLLVLLRDDLQGRLCIYELMAEDSAVNYWEVS